MELIAVGNQDVNMGIVLILIQLLFSYLLEVLIIKFIKQMIKQVGKIVYMPVPLIAMWLMLGFLAQRVLVK
jgi:hypothetical protein